MQIRALSTIFGSQQPMRFAAPAPMARLLDLDALFRQRRQLRQLDDHRLSDIGLTRAEAEAEARRPAWAMPRHRR